MSAVDFRRHGVRELLAGYAEGRFTPVDAAQACAAAVQAHEAGVHAWVAFDADRLSSAAEAAAQGAAQRIGRGEPLRLLEGVPAGVKDIFNTAEFPTQMGSALWAGFTPGNDARAVFVAVGSGFSMTALTFSPSARTRWTCGSTGSGRIHQAYAHPMPITAASSETTTERLRFIAISPKTIRLVPWRISRRATAAYGGSPSAAITASSETTPRPAGTSARTRPPLPSRFSA